MRRSNRFIHATLFASFVGISAGLPSASLAQPLDEARVNEMIGNYLRENPEVIVESLQNYQVKEQAKRIKEQADAVKKVQGVFDEKGRFPVAGNPNGDITLVEFFDYNCPACKMMFESLDGLLKEDKNVRVLFVEYPIFGPQSEQNSRLALAFNKLAPQKYFDLHQSLMRMKGKIGDNEVLNIASGLGINREALKAEAAKPVYDEMIAKDRELAKTLQIQGTPALIIGEDMVNSALPLNELKVQIQLARSKKE